MYCDDCGAALDIDLATYIRTKERSGTALCQRCRDGWPQQAADLLDARVRA